MTQADASRRRGRRLTWLLRIAVVAVLAVSVRGFIREPSQLVERDHALVLPGWPASCDGLRLDVVAAPTPARRATASTGSTAGCSGWSTATPMRC